MARDNNCSGVPPHRDSSARAVSEVDHVDVDAKSFCTSRRGSGKGKGRYHHHQPSVCRKTTSSACSGPKRREETGSAATRSSQKSSNLGISR